MRVALYRVDHIRTYLLTAWCRVLLEKLTGLQLVKKFPPFHGTRSFITALTSVRHLSLCWASPIQFIYPHPTSWRSILILSTHLRLGLPSRLLPSGFRTKTLYTPFHHLYAPKYSLFISVNHSTCFGWYLHPSSGPHVNVSTASGISKTVTATCRERDNLQLRFY